MWETSGIEIIVQVTKSLSHQPGNVGFVCRRITVDQVRQIGDSFGAAFEESWIPEIGW